MATSHLAYEEKRRSIRIDQTILLTVRGMDAFRAPYVEMVPTLILSCHGCRYRSKHEVILGNLVLLELGGPKQVGLDSTQARVKWLKETKVGEERIWDVAVELETPGNFWGVASPPEDWLRPLESNMFSRAKSGQELQVVPRSEQQIGSVNRVSAQFSMPASLAPGFSEQVQKSASEALAAVLVKEKDSVIGQFRAQLQNEMTTTLHRVIGRCKEELVHEVLRELTKELEASARSAHENWVNKIEEDLNSAAIRMTAQVKQVSERTEVMATTAIEELQLKINLLRREMTDELKIASLNICQQAEDFSQQSAQQFVNQMQERIVELKNQLESHVNERLARADCELDKKSTALLDQTQLALLKVSEGCQQSVQGQLRALAVLAAEQLLNTLNEQATEISKKSFSQLQDCTRRYLASISGSIAEVSKKTT